MYVQLLNARDDRVGGGTAQGGDVEQGGHVERGRDTVGRGIDLLSRSREIQWDLE